MTYKNPQKFDLKIRLYNQEKSFGKGVYELMKKAQSFGSLSGAYKDMKMSNSKAWKILKRAEEDLDMPLVERISGGKDVEVGIYVEVAEGMAPVQVQLPSTCT